jgi:hypothetical protein
MMVGVLTANVCLEDFMAPKFNKFILGCQPDNIELQRTFIILAYCEQNGWLVGGDYRKVY